MNSPTLSPSARSVETLFRPLAIGPLMLPNRIVMAPMTRNFAIEGVPHPDTAAYYACREANGVGLIITEAVVVDHPAAAPSTTVPRLYGHDALLAWRGVVNAVHTQGGRIVAQLWHAGLERPLDSCPNPTVASVGPTNLDEVEITQLIEIFAEAAAQAQRLGFDGIELHGAHGYLIDQFLWETTNHRRDHWGGSVSARTRFAAEVVAACRRATRPDFPLFFRFSQWKTQNFEAHLVKSPAELEDLLDPLVEAGVNVFHCSTRRLTDPAFSESDLSLAGWTRKISGCPTIAVGSVGLDSEFLSLFTEGRGGAVARIDSLLDRHENGEFDLVSVGRALLADPAWAAKIRDGDAQALIPFSREMLSTLR